MSKTDDAYIDKMNSTKYDCPLLRDDAEWILDVKILDPLARRFAIARRITKAADRIEALEARVAELEALLKDAEASLDPNVDMALVLEIRTALAKQEGE